MIGRNFDHSHCLRRRRHAGQPIAGVNALTTWPRGDDE
jgi:hypothetical protein